MTEPENSFDEMPRYIRVRSGPEDRFVELVLPWEAFRIFCEHYKVIHMDSEMIRDIDADIVKWRFGEKGHR